MSTPTAHEVPRLGRLAVTAALPHHTAPRACGACFRTTVGARPWPEGEALYGRRGRAHEVIGGATRTALTAQSRAGRTGVESHRHPATGTHERGGARRIPASFGGSSSRADRVGWHATCSVCWVGTTGWTFRARTGSHTRSAAGAASTGLPTAGAAAA